MKFRKANGYLFIMMCMSILLLLGCNDKSRRVTKSTANEYAALISIEEDQDVLAAELDVE